MLPRYALWLWCLLLCLFSFSPVVFASSKECAYSYSFTCPNCGGYQVSDCNHCVGYLFSDFQHQICIDRKLFQPTNTDPNDPNNHYHFLWIDLAAAVIWFVTAGVATACGIGGGGIYIPMGIMLLRFAPKTASGLSQASIFGAGLGALIINLPSHHPFVKITDKPGIKEEKEHHTRWVQQNNPPTEADSDANTTSSTDLKFYTRPLIHYDMALFLAPMELSGAVLGILIQKLLPNWLYLLIATFVLSITAFKTYEKYWDAHQKEVKARAKEEDDKGAKAANTLDESADADVENEKEPTQSIPTTAEANSRNESDLATVLPAPSSTKDNAIAEDEENGIPDDPTANEVSLTAHEELVRQTAITDDEENGIPDDPTANKVSLAAEEELERQKYLEEDMRQYPREKLIALSILWVVLMVLTLLIGGKGVPSLIGITCQSPWYPALVVLQFLWLFGFAAYFGRDLLKKQDERDNVRYPHLEEDPVWNMRTLRFYGIFTFCAGIVAGLIGIAGGYFVGPMLFHMGHHPRVSSATTATTMVLTSSSVAIIAITSGLVPVSYALFYFACCFLGALILKRQIDAYVKRTGRASLLILIFATIMALSTVGCMVILFTQLAAKGWCLDGFNPFCTVESQNTCPTNRFLNAMVGNQH